MIEPGTSRNGALDGMRGLAALAVIFYHSILHHEYLVSTVLISPLHTMSTAGDVAIKLALMLFNGGNAVLLFYVLSGFVLHLSLDHSRGRPATVAINFVIRRLCRLYPALWLCMALFLALAWLYHAMQWRGFPAPDAWVAAKNAMRVQIRWHGPSATIQVELLAIPFVLATFAAGRLLGTLGLLVCALYALVAMEQPLLAFNLTSMSSNLLAFAAGMLVADRRFAQVFENASQSGLWLLVCAGIVLRGVLSMNSTIGYIGQVCISAALVGGVYHASPECALRRFLQQRAVALLGRISYSLYLLNVIVLFIVWGAIDNRAIYAQYPLASGLLTGLVVSAISIPLAVLSERYVERAGIRLGHRLSRTAWNAPSFMRFASAGGAVRRP
jgi:peptidoglycan/LPS O-acetylase OafA/YrhL